MITLNQIFQKKWGLRKIFIIKYGNINENLNYTNSKSDLGKYLTQKELIYSYPDIKYH